MKMQRGLITLALLGVAGIAMAQGSEPGAAAVPAEAAAPDKMPVQVQKPAPHKVKRQGGDMRRCLNQKTNKAIIRCAEPGRKP